MLSKSLAGEEIARELINVLSITYSVRPINLLAAMRECGYAHTKDNVSLGC